MSKDKCIKCISGEKDANWDLGKCECYDEVLRDLEEINKEEKPN